ncbi:hypothetical protein [Endozoicomonas numazuensis]|uniref:Uncharacterized protein n=1 Tax=Endozoicomonas numazuensis TaxID=1137799 RepID=A0A081MYK8_9GAMM|nr:hypothetical protein [Endozoicomonas numazuensis]KEQ11281.1 hypothetical protein GZ78_29205 [Endozoicomonas numazuensis]
MKLLAILIVKASICALFFSTRALSLQFSSLPDCHRAPFTAESIKPDAVFVSSEKQQLIDPRVSSQLIIPDLPCPEINSTVTVELTQLGEQEQVISQQLVDTRAHSFLAIDTSGLDISSQIQIENEQEAPFPSSSWRHTAYLSFNAGTHRYRLRLAGDLDGFPDILLSKNEKLLNSAKSYEVVVLKEHIHLIQKRHSDPLINPPNTTSTNYHISAGTAVGMINSYVIAFAVGEIMWGLGSLRTPNNTPLSWRIALRAIKVFSYGLTLGFTALQDIVIYSANFCTKGYCLSCGFIPIPWYNYNQREIEGSVYTNPMYQPKIQQPLPTIPE